VVGGGIVDGGASVSVGVGSGVSPGVDVGRPGSPHAKVAASTSSAAMNRGELMCIWGGVCEFFMPDTCHREWRHYNMVWRDVGWERAAPWRVLMLSFERALL